VSAEGIGGVEGEVAGEGLRGLSAKGVEEAGGANEEGAIEAEEKVDDFLFARLDDARAGDAGFEAGIADAVEGGFEAVEVEVIESDARRAEADGGVELIGGANEEMDGRGCGGLGVWGDVREECGGGESRVSYGDVAGQGLTLLEEIDGIAAQLVE
jgi:hypothetical protein